MTAIDKGSQGEGQKTQRLIDVPFIVHSDNQQFPDEQRTLQEVFQIVLIDKPNINPSYYVANLFLDGFMDDYSMRMNQPRTVQFTQETLLQIKKELSSSFPQQGDQIVQVLTGFFHVELNKALDEFHDNLTKAE